MSGSSSPSLAGFQAFIQNVMGISPLYLPIDAPVVAYAYDVALALVNPALQSAGIPNTSPQQSIYALAVYNLAGDNVVNFAPDQSGRTYFANLREAYGITKFTPGVVASDGDVATSSSLLNPEFMKTLTMQNLQNMKTPWGRQYLAFSQAYGTLWGLS